jgi:hypothetical protein
VIAIPTYDVDGIRIDSRTFFKIACAKFSAKKFATIAELFLKIGLVEEV